MSVPAQENNGSEKNGRYKIKWVKRAEADGKREDNRGTWEIRKNETMCDAAPRNVLGQEIRSDCSAEDLTALLTRPRGRGGVGKVGDYRVKSVTAQENNVSQKAADKR
ncbi:unnamed protein product [Dibothriocephalus latus]|uniref:Uncharacterized protein n=1 Tax=Dibothriocephalus latus TaxID=60516 RepID=A0A3P6SKK5_DIBLA|nr:unnamed protein product [Dibothriocephalus latus]